jgi:hypothetical protein
MQERQTGPAVGAVTVQDIVPVLPAGIYPAYFARITEERNDSGEYWLWTFVARNGDVDVEITATTSPKITPRTKAAKWLSGLGVNVAVGEEVNFSNVLDMPCQLVVIINDAGYSRIDSVLPYPTEPVKAKK